MLKNISFCYVEWLNIKIMFLQPFSNYFKSKFLKKKEVKLQNIIYVFVIALTCAVSCFSNSYAYNNYVEANSKQNVKNRKNITLKSNRYRNLRDRPIENIVNKPKQKEINKVKTLQIDNKLIDTKLSKQSIAPKTELLVRPLKNYNKINNSALSDKNTQAPQETQHTILPWLYEQRANDAIKQAEKEIYDDTEVAESNIFDNAEQQKIDKSFENELTIKEITKTQPQYQSTEIEIIEQTASPLPQKKQQKQSVIDINNSANNKANFSKQTKDILNKLPNDVFPKDLHQEKDFELKRLKPSEQIIENSKTQNGITADVVVKRQSIDVNYELDKAYNNLIRGNTENAIAIYNEILQAQPQNKHALFGLATTYHKLGISKKARPIYGKLLEMDPYNKEALNNFLALVGEESPESAIVYLENLKKQNSDFSPIYAQLAQLYSGQGNDKMAIEHMQYAVDISPENLVYKYNLAVMYDQAKQTGKAIVIYRQLIKSGLEGKELPANVSDIQKRLTFLSSK